MKTERQMRYKVVFHTHLRRDAPWQHGGTFYYDNEEEALADYLELKKDTLNSVSMYKTYSDPWQMVLP